MPLNKMLGNQTKTQLWALDMTPKARKQRLHSTKQQQKPNEK